MNTLFIETNDAAVIAVKLIVGDAVFDELRPRTRTQETLPLIEELVNRAGISISDIHEVKVNRGPGSFTGLRVGVAIANALSFALTIPVNGHTSGYIETPQY